MHERRFGPFSKQRAHSRVPMELRDPGHSGAGNSRKFGPGTASARSLRDRSVRAPSKQVILNDRFGITGSVGGRLGGVALKVR